MPARWSIVSTMYGIPEIILPCVAHHLNSDAERIHIYLDGPVPEVEAALATQPRCVVTVCDAAYWAGRPGGRPEILQAKQLANLAHARRHSDSDWLVHVDSDEFLVNADPALPLALGEELARVPERHDWARILPMERVMSPTTESQTIFDGIFRKQVDDPELIAAAYGPGAPFLFRGLSGHARGKVAFRRKTPLRVRIHDVIYPLPAGVKAPVVFKPSELPVHKTLQHTHLLHFEGWSALQWTAKLMKIAEEGQAAGFNPGRRAAIAYMVEHPVAEDRASLFSRVRQLSGEGLSLLAAAGLLRQTPFDPIALTRATFPDVEMDFSVSRFDARLRASNPDFYRRNGL